ncbi:MAG TPA: GDP-mannose 4,6-dehydratase [Bacteroidia bacterium]|nr:GDP-mannose 4,6-dehydratase [Bacteroidia bacterium]
MKKRALIIGILGQDGSYMAELLYSKGYEVAGIVRTDAAETKIKWLQKLVPVIKFYFLDCNKKEQLERAITDFKPDEIYNFAGVSDVFKPYSNLDEIININVRMPQYVLEIINSTNKGIKFWQAGSALIYGKDTSGCQNEATTPNPLYPYGCSKMYIQNIVKQFREDLGLFACTGILYPHESPRRKDNFFTKKVCLSIARIKQGKLEALNIGVLTQVRDWSYAPDICEAAWLMLQADKPDDYVIGSGVLTSLFDFVKLAFNVVDLNWTNYLVSPFNNEQNVRKLDTNVLKADITKINKELGWKPKHNVSKIVEIMMLDALKH